MPTPKKKPFPPVHIDGKLQDRHSGNKRKIPKSLLPTKKD
jgi:hypothetical protein